MRCRPYGGEIGLDSNGRYGIKTIVISGAHSNVGKTRLARELCGMLPGALHVKIGHGTVKEGRDNVFFHVGTPFPMIEREIGHAEFAVIESNRVLDDIEPDCAIYLPGGRPKPSAERVRGRADIVRGEPVSRDKVALLAGKLGLAVETVLEIVERAGAMLEENT